MYFKDANDYEPSDELNVEPYGTAEVFSHVFSKVSRKGEQRIDHGNFAQPGELVFVFCREAPFCGVWEVKPGPWNRVVSLQELEGFIIFPQFGIDRPILVHETGCYWLDSSLNIHNYNRNQYVISSQIDCLREDGKLERVTAVGWFGLSAPEEEHFEPTYRVEPEPEDELDMIIDLLRDT